MSQIKASLLSSFSIGPICFLLGARDIVTKWQHLRLSEPDHVDAVLRSALADRGCGVDGGAASRAHLNRAVSRLRAALSPPTGAACISPGLTSRPEHGEIVEEIDADYADGRQGRKRPCTEVRCGKGAATLRELRWGSWAVVQVRSVLRDDAGGTADRIPTVSFQVPGTICFEGLEMSCRMTWIALPGRHAAP